MLLRRRTLAAAPFLLAAPGVARAQAWRPNRPIRAIVPFTAGGPTDVLTRMMSDPVQAMLGQPLVVENRTGAGGTIGADMVAKAAPDGHTILVNDSAHGVAPALIARLPYDPVTDFAGVGVLVFASLILLVHPSVRANSLAELVALMKAQPGRLNMATTGVGGPVHIAAEILKTSAGVQMEMVHYRGGAPAALAVVGGEAQMTILSASASLEHIRAGTMRPLAVTVERRSPLLPEVPTSAEAGLPGFVFQNWRVCAAPAATPAPILAALSAAFQAGLAQNRERLAALGEELRPGFDTPEAVRAFLRREVDQSVAVLRAAGVRPE
ncbi:Bug family tripartite tricarboxylate transporter substrate binding protein [Roseomonas fluvialis]|uniref:ABC transporter substrate-binding protein n=1 Tax=Roseomonas fluvialis TaxID=1750527 RepID=A0ABN6P2N4_9PROT|nr:tripartite tricarboxylate transporter substrate-binding protein [Roseomonas fluvialis]BDG72907.1 ABC transporter substrate-binding protein [Roseomonas fluvialis]